ENFINEGEYDHVVSQATEALDNPGEFSAELLFQRSIAYIELNKHDLAIEDLENSLQVKSDFPEVYYNLALLYNASDDQEKAKEMVKKAYQLKPEDESYQKIYEQIMGE